MSLLDDGSDWLAEVYREDHDITVIYSKEPHGKGYEIPIKATVGRDVAETDEGQYNTLKISSRDFLIQAKELTFSSSTSTNKLRHEPQPGDRIRETQYDDDGTTALYERTYEVHEPPGDGPWRWHDDQYHTYRIHTTLIEEKRL